MQESYETWHTEGSLNIKHSKFGVSNLIPLPPPPIVQNSIHVYANDF